jgi:HEXXH motif-containing protein
MPSHDLTLGETSDTARRVLSSALRRLAQDLARLRPRASVEVLRSFDAVRAVFVRELAREPGRVFTILRRPNVGVFVRVLRELPPDAPRARVDALTASLACTLAIELTHAGAALEPLSFPLTPRTIVCLGGRFVLPGGGPATLRDGAWHHDDHVHALVAREVHHHPIDRGIVLATVDDNPLAMMEAHPDKAGNSIDLGGRSIEAWCGPLREALELLAAHLPVVREEAELLLHQIVPVGVDDEKHLSASYREALGTIYLTLHPSLMTMTEAVVHELMHTKLNAMLELDPLLENAFFPLFASPVRPDPRPLHGVLLAVHAFLPVAELYRRMIEADHPLARSAAFRERHRVIARKNHDGATVLLANARPTEAGRALLDEIARLDARFEATRA